MTLYLAFGCDRCNHGCKERYKKGLLWAGRGMIPVNELT